MAAAPGGTDAFIDLFGPDYVQLAVDLGVAPERIDTVIARDKAREVGAKVEGSVDASSASVLAEMADLVASGRIELPVAATYPLERVRDAYAELEKRHTHGKIVLVRDEAVSRDFLANNCGRYTRTEPRSSISKALPTVGP